jgi:hypothetical protein
MPIHPNKEIQAVITYAEGLGWIIMKGGSSSHAWGKMRCPEGTREGCPQRSIWSTPRNPTQHARQLKRFIDKCTHKGDD